VTHHDIADLSARVGLEPMMTIDELAMLARQSRRTIERRIADGTIEVKHYGARCVRISRESAATYLASADEGGSVPPPRIQP
jgi:excisionase family DNA binding protein